MKILQVHNFYRSQLPSGENQVVSDDRDMLEGAGHIVVPLYGQSDELTRFSQRLSVGLRQTGLASTTKLRELMVSGSFDVVHVHNLQPILSPLIPQVCAEAGIPCVRTIHNYRIQCISGTHFRNGAECFKCLDLTLGLPGIKYRCYRNSFIESAVITIVRDTRRSAYLMASRLIALSPYMRDYLVGAGVPKDNIVFRPNPVKAVEDGLPFESRTGFLFLGRLDAAKGARNLLHSWAETPDYNGELTIAGSGPEQDAVLSLVSSSARVAFVGQQTRAEAVRLLRSVRALIVPSLWAEGFPRVIAEAWAVGTPVIVNDTQGLRSLVTPERGWVIDINNSSSLNSALREACTPAKWTARSTGGLKYAEELLSPAAGLRSLLSIYREVIDPSYPRPAL